MINKHTELTMFVDKLLQLVDEQQHEVEKAVVGCGKYYLQSQYGELGVPQSRWFAMNKEQRRKKLKKFNDMHVLAVAQVNPILLLIYVPLHLMLSQSTLEPTSTESVQPSLSQPVTNCIVQEIVCSEW